MRRILPLAVLLAACSGGVKSSSLSLSARAGSRVSGQAAPVLPTGITLARVRIALREIELRSRTGDRRAKIEAGPLVLDLAGADLAGGVHRVLDASVPAGTYDKIEFEIRRLESATDAAGDELVRQHASILIDGTIDGQTFSFTSGIEAEQEREGTFTVGDKTANITFDVDPTGWFVKNGARLDPRDPANREVIEANLRTSIDAFQDDAREGDENHDGDDDHGEHDGGDDDDGHHDGGDHDDDGPDGGHR